MRAPPVSVLFALLVHRGKKHLLLLQVEESTCRYGWLDATCGDKCTFMQVEGKELLPQFCHVCKVVKALLLL